MRMRSLLTALMIAAPVTHVIAGQEIRVRGPGPGFYDRASLSGSAAAATIHLFMRMTNLPCTGFVKRDVTVGVCNLNASTDKMQIIDYDDKALMLASYENDTGGVNAFAVGLWQKMPDRVDKLVGFNPNIKKEMWNAAVVGVHGSALFIGANPEPDAYSHRVVTSISAAGAGDLKIGPAVPLKVFLTEDRPSSILVSNTKMSQRVAPVGLDLSSMTLRGEHGTTYVHNGSEVVVFQKAGVIVYDNPRQEIASLVHRGDVLFKGTLTGNIVGTAYVFRNGCSPIPYHVSGAWRVGTLELLGPAPILPRTGCESRSRSLSLPNAHLQFKPPEFDEAG